MDSNQPVPLLQVVAEMSACRPLALQVATPVAGSMAETAWPAGQGEAVSLTCRPLPAQVTVPAASMLTTAVPGAQVVLLGMVSLAWYWVAAAEAVTYGVVAHLSVLLGTSKLLYMVSVAHDSKLIFCCTVLPMSDTCKGKEHGGGVGGRGGC